MKVSQQQKKAFCKMDVQTETTIAAVLSQEKVRLNQAEDSGYHTFTPGSFESSGLSCDIVDNCGKLVTTITGQIQIVTPDIIQLRRRYHRSISSTTPSSPLHTPPIRRALKRPYCSTENADAHINSVPTPTSYIAGKIQSLHFNDKTEFNKITQDNNNHQLPDCAQISEYPTTPVKRNCKLPCKRSAKKLDFTTHSLLCESNGLQFNSKSNKKQYKKLRIQSKVRANLFKSDPKIDIISRLYQECGTGPPIMKILNYISYEDILNFNLVSRYWNDIWEDVSEENILKQHYREYLRISKENLENKDKGATPKKNKNVSSILKDIQNDLKDRVANTQVTIQSPPSTPRTNRFKKFTKSASLDSRLQMSCVRCSQPGKVTEEISGEVWVGCTSSLCSYQFCKFCTCDRHPGKSCFQYDLNGPSPSKRKKTHYGICSKKSRRNLHRLL